MAPSKTLDDRQRPSARHYPLDIDLPFEHYEHRRIAARDIIVSRVMSKLLFPPTNGLAQAFDTVRPGSHENSLHNFGPIKRHDRALAYDLELLRKMLTTCSITDNHFEPLCFFTQVKVPSSTAPLRQAVIRHGWRPGVAGVAGEKVTAVRPTIGEEIEDLVRRHYLETDDACLRVWLQTLRGPSLSSYNTLPTSLRPDQTHSASAQWRNQRDKTHVADDGKTWYHEDTERLAAISTRLRDTGLPSLYDGGPFLPQLRRPLISSKAARADYLASNTESVKDILLHHKRFWDCIMDMVYPWPEGDAPRRVLHVPSCRWRSKKQWVQAIETSLPVDFSSGMTGRGLQRKGAWSTAMCGDGIIERGRSARRLRRRATSEPPRGVFTSARLPLPFSRLDGFLIFPQMKLDTMYQRSRRRSLSRTRIAEMFDWNTRPRHGHDHDQGGRHEEPQYDAQHNFGQTSSTHESSMRLHVLDTCLEDKITGYETGMEVDWAQLNGMLRGVVGEADACKLAKHKCPNCASPHLFCTNPCGFCGAQSPNSRCVSSALSVSQIESLRDSGHEFRQHENPHMANDCPVARQNRCKCVPFPQYHVASKCAVLCSRECGNRYPPGHFKHKNAMTCKSRCCMCGIKGHSGSQCKLKRCRCGGSHLGQDCTWKVECRVEGCYNFLCGLHCSECRMSREQLEEGSRFEGRKCPACLRRTGLAAGVTVQDTEGGQDDAEGMVSSDAAQEGSQRRRRRNPRKRRGTQPKDTKAKGKEKEELPWYAPLQPRTRPIVVSKSGKRNTWRGPAKT